MFQAVEPVHFLSPSTRGNVFYVREGRVTTNMKPKRGRKGEEKGKPLHARRSQDPFAKRYMSRRIESSR